MTDPSRGWDGHSRHVINTNANRAPELVVGGTPRELQDSLEIHIVDAAGAMEYVAGGLAGLVERDHRRERDRRVPQSAAR